MGILLVYDITDEQSFLNIRNWVRNIEQHASNSTELLLIGNKCDLNEDRQVTTERGKQLAQEYNMQFFETSAKADLNVQKAFIQIAHDILANAESTENNRMSMDSKAMEAKSKSRRGKGCPCIIL